MLDLQKGWKPQGDMFPFSVLQHTTVPVCVLPSSHERGAGKPVQGALGLSCPGVSGTARRS